MHSSQMRAPPDKCYWQQSIWQANANFASPVVEAQPPIINSWSTNAPVGVGIALDTPKQSALMPACSMPTPKQCCAAVNAPTSPMWATAPQEGPLLLSLEQVTSLGTYIDRDVCLLTISLDGQNSFKLAVASPTSVLQWIHCQILLVCTSVIFVVAALKRP
jgi:hypothetical protein